MRKQDAQAGDVPFMDGLGHSPVVPHPRQSQPASSYRVAATTASDKATAPA
ncbi:hypothetical protein [Actinomyces oris]|uniref:hypothetical protein n=1 Tax=Actinomyces oris TaxID=544580 RepID=UPI0028D2F7DA|nr:hypothetical protein [Actinomyces oris]